ncbi:hypothetical protein HUJ05_011127 [Dendroctonus ponderosae]|nr:hypothetical protein HUJ05_011127 [Dendroctonus ponderosae]
MTFANGELQIEEGGRKGAPPPYDDVIQPPSAGQWRRRQSGTEGSSQSTTIQLSNLANWLQSARSPVRRAQKRPVRPCAFPGMVRLRAGHARGPPPALSNAPDKDGTRQAGRSLGPFRGPPQGRIHVQMKFNCKNVPAAHNRKTITRLAAKVNQWRAI